MAPYDHNDHTGYTQIFDGKTMDGWDFAPEIFRVEGDEIVCPYHAWRFNTEGRCTAIPQLEDPTKVPGRTNRKPRAAQPEKFPASFVRIASAGRSSRSVEITRPG